MKSSSSSCLGSFLLLIVALVLVRFALPELWLILAGAAKVILSFGVLAFLALIGIVGYFTYRNLQANKQKQQEKKYEHIGRTEMLYRSVVDRLQQDLTLNQISAEEFLQSEMLISEKLPALKKDLVRLKDFASPQNEKVTQQQIRNYKQQLQQSRDETAKEVIRENLKMLEEKQERMASAQEEIRQKEASVDLVYNSLVNVEEDLKFGRAVRRLFPADFYRRFDLSPPAEQAPLPPLMEKSSSNE
jgi:hypothetical protein